MSVNIDDFPEPRTLQNDEWGTRDYAAVMGWRAKVLREMKLNPAHLVVQREFYRTRPAEWINHWCWTYDPRLAGGNGLTTMPFILFKRQEEFVNFVHEGLKSQAPLLCEKSRDMGVTWICCCLSVWLWLYWPGAAIGWGSRTINQVDKIGDVSSIFEKMRTLIRLLPAEMLPEGFVESRDMTLMKIINPENGNSITGELGDNIGRGGRTLVYFKDESAHYEHPEMIEASLGNNTNVQVDVSSVNGPASVFQRKRDAGEEWLPGRQMRQDATNVFVFDWSQHPDKTKKWYEDERKKKTAEGLAHIFAQEVDRNPSAAVVGTIIDDRWVRAAFGAAERLELDEVGGWIAGLDVADSDDESAGDRNALAVRRGIVLQSVQEWGERDVGVTTRTTIDHVRPLGRVEVNYDSIGLGSAVKSEVNRLRDEGVLPKSILFVPWTASAAPEGADRHVDDRDPHSPLIKDYLKNLKAQGWWELSRRFERTWRALNEPGFKYDPSELISFPEDLPQRLQIIKELTQPTWTRDGALRRMVDKKPDGARSPNVGDAIMMCYWPAQSARPMVINRSVVERSRSRLGRVQVPDGMKNRKFNFAHVGDPNPPDSTHSHDYGEREFVSNNEY